MTSLIDYEPPTDCGLTCPFLPDRIDAPPLSALDLMMQMEALQTDVLEASVPAHDVQSDSDCAYICLTAFSVAVLIGTFYSFVSGSY